MVALLCYGVCQYGYIESFEGALTLGSSRMRALVRFVARLLAIVAEALGGGADFSVVADIATFVAGSACKGCHI